MAIQFTDFYRCLYFKKKAPELPRPYKVPLYPIVPIIAILGAIFILGMTMMTQTKLALIGIGVTLIGIPVYYQKRKTLRRVKYFNNRQKKYELGPLDLRAFSISIKQVLLF